MITEEKKDIERGTEFLDEALTLAREVVVLRNRLNIVHNEYSELLSEREAAAREGRDLSQQIRPLFLESEDLPPRIFQLEQRVYWLVDQGVEKLNASNRQAAAKQYMKCRDGLRQALETFREKYISVQAETKTGTDLGPPLTAPSNSKLAEIENILGGLHFSRVIYRLLPLPTIDAAAVARGELLGAIENWISCLR